MSERLQPSHLRPPAAVEPVELTTFHEPSSDANSTVAVAEESSPSAPVSHSGSRLLAPVWAVFRAIRGCYWFAGAVLVLAVVAAIPLVNFWVLGYLLDAEGRLARSGKWREAFPEMRALSRIASIGVGMFLWLVPLRVLAGAAVDARLIEAGSPADVGLHRALFVGSAVVIIHICLALARGGSLSCFFRPLKNIRWLVQQVRQRQYLEIASRKTREFIATLRIHERFWLGLRGFFGALTWLVVPSFLYAAATSTQGGAIVVTIIGGVSLVPVLSWLPLLQARFAAEGRLRAMFELKTVRSIFRRAPLAGTVAVIATLVLSLPLYLAKIVLPPRDAMWMVTLVFIISIWPVKLLSGWAYYRGTAREGDAWWGLRWLGRIVMLPLLAAYVFLLLFTPSLGEHGKLVLFEHHAFLLPVPF